MGDSSVKQILLELLEEVEDLRSDLTVALNSLQPPLELGRAYDLKSGVAKISAEKYAVLRAMIGSLPS
jgi:hypothetical protein